MTIQGARKWQSPRTKIGSKFNTNVTNQYTNFVVVRKAGANVGIFCFFSLYYTDYFSGTKNGHQSTHEINGLQIQSARKWKSLKRKFDAKFVMSVFVSFLNWKF